MVIVEGRIKPNPFGNKGKTKGESDGRFIKIAITGLHLPSDNLEIFYMGGYTMSELIIMETEIMLLEQELNGMKQKLVQYKKEFIDLSNRTGLAIVMGKHEIVSARRMMEKSIGTLEADIRDAEKRLEELKNEKKQKEVE